MELLGQDTLESQKPYIASSKGSTGVSSGGMLRTFVTVVTSVQHTKVHQSSLAPSFNSWQGQGAPLERVAVDIRGPFPRTDKGNRYILAAMYYFTKWPEAYVIPDQEAGTVADALVEGMFTRFEAPKVIHSNQGRNFESGVFSAMCEHLGMQKTQTTPLHPQSDGLAPSLQNINVTGTCTSLSSYWHTGQLCRIQPHAHLPCS